MLKRLVIVVLLLTAFAVPVLRPQFSNGPSPTEVRPYYSFTDTANNGFYVAKDGTWRHVQNGMDVGPADCVSLLEAYDAATH